MKLFRHRISRSAILLFFNMVLVLVSALLVLVNMQARTELEESRRGFYSDRASYLINEESSWEEIRDILLNDEWDNGIFFKKDLELESDTRGVFYKGDFKKLSEIFTKNGLYPVTAIGTTYGVNIFKTESQKTMQILLGTAILMGILSISGICMSVIAKLNQNIHRYGIEIMNGQSIRPIMGALLPSEK